MIGYLNKNIGLNIEFGFLNRCRDGNDDMQIGVASWLAFVDQK